MSQNNDGVVWEKPQEIDRSGEAGKIVVGVFCLTPIPYFASVPLAAIQGVTPAEFLANGSCKPLESINLPTILTDTCYSLISLFPSSHYPQDKVIGGIIATTICLVTGTTMIVLGARGFRRGNHQSPNLS